MNKIIMQLKEIARKHSSHSGHDFLHTLRVWQNAKKIAKTVKCDLFAVEAAALLHDIARHKEDTGDCECHAEEGAKMAKEILNELGIDSEKAWNIAHCIAVHRYSKGLKPGTIEAAILQDADRLDAIGAIAVARVFASGGKKGRMIYDLGKKPVKDYIGSKKKYSETSVNHFYEKILKLKPSSFNTKTGKMLAKQKYEFTQKFVRQMEAEIKGTA